MRSHLPGLRAPSKQLRVFDRPQHVRARSWSRSEDFALGQMVSCEKVARDHRPPTFQLQFRDRDHAFTCGDQKVVSIRRPVVIVADVSNTALQ